MSAFCPTKKVPYVTRRQAVQYTRHNGKQHRPYHCAHCGQWHTSTKGKKRKHYSDRAA